MQRWKRAGLWFAVFACVGGMGITFRALESKEPQPQPSLRTPAKTAPVVRVS